MKDISARKFLNCFLVLTLLRSVLLTSDFHGDDEHVTYDVAIKLKREYSDDLVSDLFATSYDLIKVARVRELDKEDRLFHFRIGSPSDSDQELDQHKRTKRHVENKIDLIRQDDRVDFVLPLKHLIREKRKSISFDDTNELFQEDDFHDKHKISMSDRELRELERLYEDLIDTLEEDKRKKNQIDIVNKIEDIKLHVPDEINFNDQNFKQQWYLINEGQLKIPPMHDLNVKDAWLSGYTGKNVSIVIIDDGLDHEHPDFEGKYVIYIL